ncbi:MAG TPA: protein kinase [Thermoanaerobaculia bacterium]|nr:protein kinase [Thermoanaerobaculia bacterium]
MIEKLGKYEIVEKIGVGGFGTVYRGRDPFIKRTVAVKTCQSEDEEIKKRFFREAELSGNLHHRNITTIYDFGVQDGIPYIVQEYLTGEDLDKMIKRGDVIPLARKLEILMDVCEGLGYAHAAGIIHRDIKPSNIRILQDGAVKIMDFGIAKSFQSESTLTQTGITLGTAAYLAPEQIRGEAVDPRTDIFSLGVLAYELLTGQKPFRGEHISTVLFKILNEKPDPVSRQVPEIPASVDRAVEKAIEKSPPNRYESVAEFKRDLAAIVKQIPIGDVTGATAIRPALVDNPVVRPFPSAESAGAGITPPSGALARSPVPPDATPSGARRNVSLELMDFRDPNAVEEPAPVPAAAGTAPVAVAPAPGGTSHGMIFGIVVAVLAIGGGAYWYFAIRPLAAPPPAVSRPPAPTAPASPAIPPPAAQKKEAKPEAATENKAESKPEAPPQKAEKKKEEPPPKAEPAAPRKIPVSFSTTPSATLYLDGKEVGETVPRKTLKLDEGKHTLRFELEDGTTFEQAFEVGRGGQDSFFHQFPIGSILVTAGPEWKGAKVLVDSKLRGRIPLSGVLMASPGAHEIAVIADGIPPVLKTIKVEANHREEVHIAAPEKTP